MDIYHIAGIMASILVEYETANYIVFLMWRVKHKWSMGQSHAICSSALVAWTT